MIDIKRIIIVGFDNYSELDRVLNDFMDKTGILLFCIICGGLGDMRNEKSLSEIWAERYGAPVELVYADNVESLLQRTSQTADYLIWKYDENNNFGRRLLMKMKELGKHGMVIR